MKPLQRLLSLLLGITVFSACSDQGEPDFSFTASERRVRHSCAEMNKLTNLLDYQSFKQATVCWGWDRDYPAFYSALLKIDPDAWNHIMTPFDEFFFNHRGRRDKYLKLVNEMERRGVLGDFASLLNVTTENDFNGLLHRILAQSLDNSRAWNKTMLFEVMEILKLDPEAIAHLQKLYHATSLALRGKNKNLNPVFKKLVDKQEFREKRINVVDQLFTSLKNLNVGYFDRHFINSFLSHRDENDRYWLHQWINQLSDNPRPLFKLLAHGRASHPTATQDLSNLVALAPQASCSVEGEGGYLLNFEVALRLFMERLAQGNRQELGDFFNRSLIDIHLTSELCNISGPLGIQAQDIRAIMRNVLHSIEDRDVHPFLQRVQQNIFTTEEHLNQRNTYYFINFYLGDFHQTFLDFNQYLISTENSHYLQIIANIAASYPEQAYESFVYLARRAMASDNLEIFSAVATLWQGLSVAEKSALLKLGDVFFAQDLNYPALMELLQGFVDDLHHLLPLLANQMAKDDGAKSKTLRSLYNISRELRGQKVLADLRGIFSTEELLKTVRLLAGAVFGGTEQGGGEGKQSGPGASGEERFFTVLDLLGGDHIACSDPMTCHQEERQCLEHLATAQDLGQLLAGPLVSCQNIESEYFPVHLVQHLHQANRESQELGYGQLITARGPVGRGVLNELVGGLLRLQEGASPIGPVRALDLLKAIILERKHPESSESPGLGALEETLRLWRFFSTDNSPGANDYLTFLSNKLATVSDGEIAQYVQIFSGILEHYSLSRVQRKQFIARHSCRDMFKQTYRLGSCPEAQEIKQGVKKILTILKQKHPGKKSPLELLVQAVAGGHGLEIPYLSAEGEKKHIRHVIDLQQYLLYAYDSLTHSSTVRFYTGVDQKKNYFDSIISDAEQMEIVIRDAGFFGNYFGLYFLNATTLGWDYVASAKTAVSRFKHLANCLNNSFCRQLGGPLLDMITLKKFAVNSLPKEARFLSANVVNTAQALIAAGDEYKHGGKLFSHDNFIKTLLAIFVQSSPEEAQFRGLFSKMSDRYADIHNGMAILHLAEMSAPKNMARVVYDRLGPQKEHFDQVVFGDELQRVNRKFFQGIEVEKTQRILLGILHRHLGSDRAPKALDNVLEATVEWVSHLPYAKQRIVEEVLGDIAIIASSLGPDLEDKDFASFANTYRGQQLFNHLEFLEHGLLIAEKWLTTPGLKRNAFAFFDAIRNPLRFVRDGLSVRREPWEVTANEVSQRRKLFYRWVNESFNLLDTLMRGKDGVGLSAFLLEKVQANSLDAFQALGRAGSRWGELLSALHFQEGAEGMTPSGFSESRRSWGQLAKLLDFYSRQGRWRTQHLRGWVASIAASPRGSNASDSSQAPRSLNLIDYLLSPSGKQPQTSKLHSALHWALVADYPALTAYLEELLVLLELAPVPLSEP